MRVPRALLPCMRSCLVSLAGAILSVGLVPAAQAQAITPPPAIAAAKKVVICADIGSPPLSFYKEDGTLVGAEFA